jgi:hypothetical protein
MGDYVIFGEIPFRNYNKPITCRWGFPYYYSLFSGSSLRELISTGERVERKWS